jgi:predicted dehydrogenase
MTDSAFTANMAADMAANVADTAMPAAGHTILIAGLGSIGQRHARNLASLGARRLIAVRSGLGTRPIPADLPIETYGTYDEALAQGPDIGIVCTPSSLHVEAAHMLLDAGLDVLVEKPISHTLDGVDRLIQTAAAASRVLGVAYPLRFHPHVATVRQWIAEHRLGSIRYARASVGQYPPSWTPGRDYRDSYAVRQDLGGGCVRTFIHEIDLLYDLFGMPRSVTAMAGHLSSLDTDAEDVAEIVFGYDHMIGSVHIDYVQRTSHRARYLHIVGEAASLWLDFQQHTLQWDAATPLSSGSGGAVGAVLDDFDFNTLHRDEAAAFIRCAETRAPFRATGCDARRGLQCALAALDSARSGRRVDLVCD